MDGIEFLDAVSLNGVRRYARKTRGGEQRGRVMCFRIACVWLTLIGLGLFGWTWPSKAADITAGKDAAGKAVIIVSGLLDLHDDEKFARVAADADDAIVWLASPGGSTLAAVNIGTTIRLRGWSTIVPQQASCASACALVWVAGARRSIGVDGRVGFHASYIVRDGQPLEAGAGNALVGAFLSKLGMKDTAVLYMTSAPPTSIAWLTPTDASQVGIAARFGTADVMPELLPTTQLASVAPAPPASDPKPVPPQPPAAPAAMTENQMMAMLYRGFPASIVVDGDRSCVREQCSLRVSRKESWTGGDGKPRQMIAAVAELKDGCHACTAVLGIAVYRWDYVAWVAETSTQSVAAVGSFGNYRGNVEVLHLSGNDPVLLLHDGDMHQGVVDEDVTIFASVFGNFKKVLDIPTGHSVGGSCDDKEDSCRLRRRAEDYRSAVTVAATSGGGLDVTQTVTAGPRKPPKVWRIGVDGQPLGRSLAASRSAQAAIVPNEVSFAAGQADRRAYEAWFAGLVGDARDGAVFWAEQRSLRNPQKCEAARPPTPDGIAGCAKARAILAPLDAKRKVDPEYRRGWNSF